jgi:L-rhamnose mutarotase
MRPTTTSGPKKMKKIIKVNRNTLPIYESRKHKVYPDIVNKLSNAFYKSGYGFNAALPG